MTIPNRWNHLWQIITVHRWKLLALFGAVLLPLYVFGELAEDIVQRESFFFDEPLLLYAYGLQTPVLDACMLFMSRID